jgi:hypothetical protein
VRHPPDFFDQPSCAVLTTSFLTSLLLIAGLGGLLTLWAASIHRKTPRDEAMEPT